MKQLLLLLSFFITGFYSIAQHRYADFKVRMTSPQPGDSVIIDGQFHLSVMVHNQGADTFWVNDTAQMGIAVGSNTIMFPVGSGLKPYRPVINNYLAPGDSINMGMNFTIAKGVVPIGATEICITVVPANAADTISDTILTDNTDCVIFQLIEDPTSISRSANSDIITTVYPNPSRSEINFGINLQSATPVSIQLYNTMGVMVLKEDTEKLQKGHHAIKVNTSQLMPGVYSYRIITDDTQQSGRLQVE